MSNPSVVTVQLVAAVANGIAQSQARSGAGNLTLNGSLAAAGVATMDVARRVSIASAGADGAIIFTVTGTNRSGAIQSETVTGVATPTPVNTVLDYKTVTRIAVSGTTAGNITVGTSAVGSSDWVVNDFLRPYWALSGVIRGPATVTTFTLEWTFDDPNDMGVSLVADPYQWSMEARSYVPPQVIAHTTILNVSGAQAFNFADNPVFAHRVTITAGTGLVSMQSIQAGMFV